MKSVNKVILLGNIGQEPETRFTNNDKAVTSFSLATTSSYKDKNGAWVEDTQWHKIVAWGLSDWVKENIGKGVKVYIEGSLKTRTYDDKDGIKRYITEITANNIIPCTKLEPKEEAELVETEEVQNGGLTDSEDLPF